jgi:hypothetical protein
MRSLLAIFLLLLSALPAIADVCTVRVNARDIAVDPAMFSDPGVTVTRRERLLAWPQRQWNRVLGAPPACSSETSFVFLATLVSLDDATGYCLMDGDPETGLLLVPGERNFRNRCVKTTCQRVNGAAADLATLTGTLGDIVAGPPAPDLSTIEHASGALLMSGPRAVLRRSMGAAAGGVLSAALSSPAAIAASTLTLVGVGSAVYLCSE